MQNGVSWVAFTIHHSIWTWIKSIHHSLFTLHSRFAKPFTMYVMGFGKPWMGVSFGVNGEWKCQIHRRKVENVRKMEKIVKRTNTIAKMLNFIHHSLFFKPQKWLFTVYQTPVPKWWMIFSLFFNPQKMAIHGLPNPIHHLVNGLFLGFHSLFSLAFTVYP